MNHGGCGPTIDDDFLRGNIGAAFWTGQSTEHAHMPLFRLPITEPIPVRCSYSFGGAEYLKTDKAERGSLSPSNGEVAPSDKRIRLEKLQAVDQQDKRRKRLQWPESLSNRIQAFLKKSCEE
jgi:hypothetical protein